MNLEETYHIGMWKYAFEEEKYIKLAQILMKQKISLIFRTSRSRKIESLWESKKTFATILTAFF